VQVDGDVVRTLKALADENRLKLFAAIATAAGAVCVCDLANVAPINQPTVSHHLRVLREAGLIEVERRGTWAYYSLRPDAPAFAREAVTTALRVPA
jgi:ArsR family transcriptional regulator